MNTSNETTKVTVSASEFEPIKPDVFETYATWRSLPTLLRYPPRDKKTGVAPTPREFCEAMGIDDEEMVALAEIKTKTEFALQFKVHVNTLTTWDKKLAQRSPLDDLRSWAMKLSKNVMLALYNNAVRKGMALEVKLWMQIIEQWNEKAVVEHDYKGVKSITYEIVQPPAHVQRNRDQEANQPEAGASA